LKQGRSLLLAILILLSLTLTANAASNSAYIDKKTNRTMVPVRFITEEIGANVKWDKENQLVTITNGTKKIELIVGSKNVKVDNQDRVIDQPAIIKDTSTYVPIRFISETLNMKTGWIPERNAVTLKLEDKTINLPIARESKIELTNKSFKTGSKQLNASVLKIDILNPKYDLKVALAKNQVGQVESLASIAKRNNALIAINGTFFDAYTDIKEPYGLIVTNGKTVHIGREKTVFSYDEQKNIDFDILNPSIRGTTGSNGRETKWYAVWMNRTPSENGSNSILFTPERGESIGFNYGTNIIIEDSIITNIKTGNVQIPKNGFVINLTGGLRDSLLSRFKIGEQIEYQVELKYSSKSIDDITGAIGVGPRLITNGKIDVNPVKEGFNDPKILTGAGARSAIGITRDHQLIFLTTRSATISDLAEMMKQAGAYQAMNLDGGASSGLYYNGKYVTTPGREISNALLIIKE